MKKQIAKFILSLMMACTVLYAAPTSLVQEVFAVTSDYPLYCGSQYEVSTVNNDGSFNKIGCYGSFNDARNVMWNNGDDAVIRHSGSYSPTGIIALNSGVAISYPMRSGKTTMNISANSSGGGKTTYVIKHRELVSAQTDSYNGSGNGRVYVKLNGFEGYADLKELDLVPMKYITNGIPIALGGNDTTSANEQPFRVTIKQANYRVEQNGNYKDLVYYAYSGYNSAAFKMVVGKAADWMPVGATYYSWDNYTFYNDRKFNSLAGTYYNYYQFLPVRSQSNITADVYNQYLSNLGFNTKPSSNNFNALGEKQSQLWNEGQTFINNQNTYGVNALLIFSMACLESGNGRSRYAIEKNNLFGWNAFDSDPDQASNFASISQAIEEQMAINLRGYADIRDARFFGSHVGNKGSGFNVKYASDPYWGMKIAEIAYKIDKLSKGNNGSLTDYDNYSLGLITQNDASVKQTANSSSNTLYTTTYGDGYQKNFTVIVKSKDSNWTQIQTTNGINTNGSLITHRTDGSSTGSNINGKIAYDFGRSVGYLPTSQVSSINNKAANKPEGTTPVGDFISKVENFNLIGKNIFISGYAYQPGIYLENDNATIHHYLVLTDINGKKQEIELSPAYFNEEHYNNAGFINSSIDITQFAVGEYTLSLKTVHPQYTEERNFVIGSDLSYSLGKVNYSIKTSDQKTKLKIVKEQIEVRYVSSLKSISLDSDLKLHLKGISLIQGVENIQENVKHELIVTDLNTNTEVLVKQIASSMGDYSLTDVYNHGLNYDYGWYEDSVDLSQLPEGNYLLSVKTSVGDLSYTNKLYGSSSFKNSDIIEGSDGLYRQLSMQYSFSYRAEISVNKFKVDKIVKNPLPRIREGYQSLISIDYISDTQSIKVNGSALIWNGSFSNDDEVKYTLMAMNKSDGSVYSYQALGSSLLDGEQAPWNNTSRINSGFNYDNTWYSITVPLQDLTDGTYEFLLAIETKDYIEYVDLKKVADSGLVKFTQESKVVNCYVNQNDKQKVQMKLAGYYVPPVQP